MDEDDLERGKIKDICHVLLNQFDGIVIIKPLVVDKLSLFSGSGMKNDALMHREGLKGYSNYVGPILTSVPL